MVMLLAPLLFLQAKAPVGEPSYQITRAQLEALGRFQSGRALPMYSWETHSAWMEHVKFPTDEDLNGRVPLVGIDSHPFWTQDRTLEAATAFPDIIYANFAYCCMITDDGIAHLRKLRSLKVLVLYRAHARFGGNGLMPMIQPKVAERMRQKLTDDAIEHISRMDSLEVLYVAQNEFSEAAILKLARLKDLKHLAVDDLQISENGLAILRAALPKCEVDVWSGIPHREPAKEAPDYKR